MREELIERLRKCINGREGSLLTDEQVSHYIGSDMSNGILLTWVEDTEEGLEPVSADDVMSLWEE